MPDSAWAGSHPQSRGLESKNAGRERTCAEFFWRFCPGESWHPYCHLERSERPMHFASAGGVHGSFASLKTTVFIRGNIVVGGRTANCHNFGVLRSLIARLSRCTI